MTTWELFEQEVLDQIGQGGDFTADEVAAEWGIPTWQVSQYIQRYTGAQRRVKSRTKYVIRRTGRTANAVWHIGVRSKDAKARVKQFGDDVKNHVLIALKPDIVAIAARNGRSVRTIEQQLAPAVNGVVEMVTAMMNVTGMDGDDGELPF